MLLNLRRSMAVIARRVDYHFIKSHSSLLLNKFTKPDYYSSQIKLSRLRVRVDVLNFINCVPPFDRKDFFGRKNEHAVIVGESTRQMTHCTLITILKFNFLDKTASPVSHSDRYER